MLVPTSFSLCSAISLKYFPLLEINFQGGLLLKSKNKLYKFVFKEVYYLKAKINYHTEYNNLNKTQNNDRSIRYYVINYKLGSDFETCLIIAVHAGVLL